MRAIFIFRLRILLGILGVIAIVLISRLFVIQIMYGNLYAQKAKRQYSADTSTLYDRGTIYFTRKDGTHIAVATLENGFLVAVHPGELKNIKMAYNAINAITPINEKTFFELAQKKNDPYEEVAHHLSKKAGEKLARQKIHGVQVIRERWRIYPAGTLAAHTIGFVAYNDDNTLSGRYGLERYYNSVLFRSGSTYRNFFAQLFSDAGNFFVDADSSRQGDIVTTIEPELEQHLMDDLARVQKKFSSKETGGIIMIPSTGAIVALGSVPTFNPNYFENEDASTFGNPLVEHVYEFGSIVKALTMASGLDAGVITPQTTYDDTGCITVDKARICNWDNKARGVIPMIEIIKQSLNVGASWIATQLGNDTQRAYFMKLFGHATGVDLSSETTALLSNLKSPRQVEYDTAAFGQGIAVTPMQMIRAIGALANGGVMVAPHLVSEKILQSGKIEYPDWSAKERVFSAKSTQETVTMMDALMDDELSHGKARIPTMSVAVKTGTAQLTKPEGGYYKNRFFHSFVGFFPSYAPRFIILLYTDDPHGAEYSAETLTTSFMDLTHFLINYYNIAPDRGITNKSL
ncbi:Cell division protein FtsI [Peptidoglycan synthetase] [hydrothermal vent metagenome]|uniref:Cell division protein FtsI [Peptidoglycan synthetase] n=1 Tax=hydrothermal vent metagenome TaxID=652676 RepID=A0A3B0UXU8_9ZZZZ